MYYLLLHSFAIGIWKGAAFVYFLLPLNAWCAWNCVQALLSLPTCPQTASSINNEVVKTWNLMQIASKCVRQTLCSMYPYYQTWSGGIRTCFITTEKLEQRNLRQSWSRRTRLSKLFSWNLSKIRGIVEVPIQQKIGQQSKFDIY